MLNINSSTNLSRQICQSLKLLPGFLKHCTSRVTIREVACYHLMNTTETYAKLPNLKYMYLSNNQISSCIPENIGEVVPNLSILDLSNNSISGFIPNSIGNMKVLGALDLSKNKLMGPIPTSMGNLKKMMTLMLRGNTLSGEIPSSLKNCTQLEVLDLCDNQLSGNLPSWIGQSLTSLRVLSLRSNKLIGGIPKIMSSLYSLQVFDAAENCLLGTIPDIFTTFIVVAHNFYYIVRIDIVAKGLMMNYTEFLSLVTCIDLSRNNFSRRIPESLTKLIGLRGLNLFGNHMIGKIPQEINQLQELESMDLSNNLFFGGIPLRMSSMNSLGALNLSYNNLSGPIPFAGHMSTFDDASTYYGNENLCGPPLPTKCDSPISNNVGDLRTGSPEVRQFWISAGLGFVNGFGGWYSVLAIKRK
ncbi:hypothetical protein AMTRI_Chr07g30180 [Amborella trichopoda]